MTKGNQRIIHQVYLTRNFHLISFLLKRNKRGGTLLLWTIQQKMTRSLIYDLKWSINCQGCGTWIDSKNGLSFIISAPSLELYHFRKFFISDISFPMKTKLDCRIIAGELGCRDILRPVRKTEKRQQQQQQQKREQANRKEINEMAKHVGTAHDPWNSR